MNIFWTQFILQLLLTLSKPRFIVLLQHLKFYKMYFSLKFILKNVYFNFQKKKKLNFLNKCSVAHEVLEKKPEQKLKKAISL